MKQKYNTSVGRCLTLLIALMGWLTALQTFAQCNTPNTLTIPSTYTTSALVGNGNFNAIIFGNHRANSGDTEGRLAVGGSFSVNTGYSVGLAAVGQNAPAQTDNFIVNGTFTNTSGIGWAVRGNFIYTTNGPGSILPTHGAGEGVNIQGVADNRINFAPLKNYYSSLSSSLTALTQVGSSAVNAQNEIVLTGNGTAQNYVFNVTLPTNTISGVIFNNIPAAGSTILINILNMMATFTGGAIANTAYQTRTLFNFPNATSLGVTNFLVEGSVLAPNADFTGRGGGINGQSVIGGNVTQREGFEFHNICLEQANPLVPTLSGNVFDDGNGLTDNTVNHSGSGPNPVNGTDIDPQVGGNQALYATLVNSGIAVATVSVTPAGTYFFTNVGSGTYSVVLSTNPAGSTTPSLPTSWTNTGENLGAGVGDDGTVNGILTGIIIGTASVGNANFGIDKKPAGANATDSPRGNPGGTLTSPVSATVFTGTDLEDGIYPNNLTGRVVSLTAAINGTLYYDRVPVSTTITITNFDPTLVTIDPTAPGATTPATVPTFTYSVKDDAGVPSDLKTITVPFIAVPDLTPIIYARPSTVYGTTDITVVVDVLELNSVATNGLITVRVTKDSKVSLSFPTSATLINNRSVQNSVWTFSDSNSNYYTLTTTQVVGSGDVLSFGFTGTLTPGATTGVLTISPVIIGGSGGEVRINNNVDADKIDYFQQ